MLHYQCGNDMGDSELGHPTKLKRLIIPACPFFMIFPAILLLASGIFTNQLIADEKEQWNAIQQNAFQSRDAFEHCHRFVEGWLARADSKSGLIPRNLKGDFYWNARDSAADNYPFMVLTCALTDRPRFHGRMKQILRAEQKLTNRLGNLPDDYSFETQSFRRKHRDHAAIIFGASEYVKDGLLPLTEWLGPSPWSNRMLQLLDGILLESKIDTPVGMLPATDHEVCGELLQSYCRAYWMTKNKNYCEMAFRIADYFFLHNIPTRKKSLSLDDHGCEVIGGLSEAYYLASYIDKERRQIWKPVMHEILDRILETGRDEYGFFYNRINPVNGEILNSELTDNWGYNYNAFLTVAELDHVKRYRDAVLFVLSNLEHRKDYLWENGGADGFADSIEGGINLLNRIPLQKGFDWVDYSTNIMLKKQKPNGIIEGWHGDGNYARTAIMYALWKTKGTSILPWRKDVSFGAEKKQKETLRIAIHAEKLWNGHLIFDQPRHKKYLNLPTDYARLNQFPEWFTVEVHENYSVLYENDTNLIQLTGEQLQKGLPVQVEADQWSYITVKRVEK